MIKLVTHMMLTFSNKFRYLLLSLLFSGVSLTSCVDEPLVKDTDPVFDEGYSINVALTLDPMGGTRAGDGIINPFEKIENYINPELLRILFFDENEEFLFESKSRWVRELKTNGDYSSWLVSVPFYDMGTEKEEQYRWSWDYIREKMMNGKFKIAILANRPTIECYPDLSKENALNAGTKSFDNSGPHWTKANTRPYAGNNVKHLFDLHHSQWDPIYSDKGYVGTTPDENYYDFISERGEAPSIIKEDERKLQMSSTSCWVDHGLNYDDTGVKDSNGNRQNRLPSTDYPIPMYGVQEFDPVTDWVEGIPYNLSQESEGSSSDYTHKSISLLRSVVKLELLVSTDVAAERNIGYIGLKYPNVYARCEPMDIWTPTEQIWKDDHDNDCEWIDIMNYGLISSVKEYKKHSTDENSAEARRAYREKISWFYGSWLDKGPDGNPRWSFPRFGVDNVVTETPEKKYPRIFNPVIQRNSNTALRSEAKFFNYTSNYHYFVIYTGERNMNHPAYLYSLQGQHDFSKDSNVPGGNGRSLTVSWVINIGGYSYNIPIKDYSGDGLKYLYRYANSNDSKVMPGDAVTYDYQIDVWNNPDDRSVLPWPLLRNHVYRIVIGGDGAPFENTRGGDGAPELRVISSTDKSSPTIKFQ